MNEMNGRLRAHIDLLLQEAPRTKDIDELREELYGGCCDKYNDLRAAGRETEEAFNEVVAGIGDVQELVGAITKTREWNPTLALDHRRKRALFICAGIAVFMVGCVIALLLSEVLLRYSPAGDSLAGIFILLSLTVSAILIIYGVITTSYKYEKQGDTIVEDVKTNMVRGSKQQRLFGAASSSLWMMTTVVYLFLSFLTGWWHITWLIFLVASVLQTLLKAYFSPPGHRMGAIHGAFWTMTVLLYFLVSFLSNDWHVTWAIFILAAAVQQIIRLLSIWRE